MILKQGVWEVVEEKNRVIKIRKAGDTVLIINPKLIDTAEISFVPTRTHLEIRMAGQPIMRVP